MMFLVLLALPIPSVLVIVWIARRQARARRADSGDHPPGRGFQDLVMSEQDLFTDRPAPLAGRPDEVYLGPRGELIPVETKTRGRGVVYLSDRIQLSVYAVLLRHAKHRRLPGKPGRQGRPVASYGYVRLVITQQYTQWKRVELLSESDVVRLAERRRALEQGKVRPHPANNPTSCRRCSYRAGCPQRRAS